MVGCLCHNKKSIRGFKFPGSQWGRLHVVSISLQKIRTKPCHWSSCMEQKLRAQTAFLVMRLRRVKEGQFLLQAQSLACLLLIDVPSSIGLPATAVSSMLAVICPMAYGATD